MERIKDTSVEAVRQNADFVAVVEERTPLRKAGARLTGRCPFHEEKTPSFSVNPVEKLYYCHGCHKGSDMIGFVQDTQSVDFVGAVEWLADRFRIPIEYEESAPGEDERRTRSKRLLSSTTQRVSTSATCGNLLPELRARLFAGCGCTKRPAASCLGLAIGGTTLARKAHEKDTAEAQAAGLSRRGGGDYFGAASSSRSPTRAAACSASRAGSTTTILQAKYVNTPESELFTKGESGKLARPRPPRSTARTGCASSRATPTSSRSARPRSSLLSRAWAPP
jgi:DNA primase